MLTMSMSTFKFDFSPTFEGGTASVESSTADGQCKVLNAQNADAANANALIAKLLHRAETNVNACALWNASSNMILSIIGDNSNSINDRVPSGKNGKEEFAPLIRFQSHESIHLASSTYSLPTMEKLRYVLPKHTLSDTTTDLIPGVYEGGLKVWECSIDLCRYLADITCELPSMMADDAMPTATSSFAEDDLIHVRAAVKRCIESDGTTLELGCGHGLPGCLIVREKIRRSVGRVPLQQNVFSADDSGDNSVVIFSDFNDFVLHHATILNAQLNVSGMRHDDGVAMDECRIAQALLERSIFVGGDWMGLSQKLSCGMLPLPGGARRQSNVDGNRLDLILASETTYTPESCEDTAFFMLRHLKVEVGVGLVATKRFYFGVGGGTDFFTAACETLSMSDTGQFSDLRLSVRVAQSYESGIANIRDLLEVRCRRK
jgi:hypothetical protein